MDVRELGNSDTEKERPPCRDVDEIMELLNRRVPLRLSEISRVTGSSRQVLEKIERRALKKIADALGSIEEVFA